MKKFKTWFSLMFLKNAYGFIFLLAFPILVWQIINYDYVIFLTWQEIGIEKVFTCIGLLLPLAVVLLCGILGFIQFWKDYQNGRSR